MIGDLHEQAVGRATLLVRAVDGILGTDRHSWHRDEARARALFPQAWPSACRQCVCATSLIRARGAHCAARDRARVPDLVILSRDQLPGLR
jgi:hypothetical protein